MTTSLGFWPNSQVHTPEGRTPIARLAEGDAVLAYDPETGASEAVSILTVHAADATQRVRLEVDGATLCGCTPGVSVYDAFDEIYRAVGSLSSLAEVITFTDAGTEQARVCRVPEEAVAQTRVHHLTLARPHQCFVVDGVVVKHLDAP